MNLIKTIQESQSIIKQKVYTNVTFSSGYITFLESLALNGLISSDYTRTQKDHTIQWDNQLNNNGIIIETTINPLLNMNYFAGDVIITGNKQALELFDSVINLQEAEYSEQSKAKQVKVKLEYHDELNPKLWETEDKIKPKVLKKLKETAKDFFEFLDMPNLKLVDITITGSSANYNWTSSSDIDLHLLVDVKSTEKEYGELVSKYFDAQRKIWNDLHDVKIKGIPVELYVQDTKEKHYSSGIYSIQDEKWLDIPTKDKPKLDTKYIKNKTIRIMNCIDELISHCTNPDKFEKMQDKLIKMRKAGLEDAGEFSDQNYVFKSLRNVGYIDKLVDYKTKMIDKELSIESKKLKESFNEKDDPWEDLGYGRTSSTPPSTTPSPKKRRVNLNVPYAQRDAAKAIGARWDKGIRKWYMIISSNDDLKKIPSSWR